jgi:hypothetical protein
MSADEPKTYTARQIAAALGVARSTIKSGLDEVAPDYEGIADGQKSRFWSVARLPGSLQRRLAEVARQGGYRNAEHLLSEPQRPWEPTTPYAQCTDHYQKRARMLRDALEVPIQRRGDPSLNRGEWLATGLADYKAVFRHTISERRWYDLLYRTLERAGASQDFTRLDLYLDERPARKAATEPATESSEQSAFPELQAALGTIKDRAAPTGAEKAYLWVRTLESFEARCADGEARKKVKNALVKFLSRNAPFMSPSADALRVSFNRKYDRWIEGERAAAALQDRRRENSGFHRAPELKAEDRDALIAHARFNCDGRVSQAWRELTGKNALSEELLSHHLSNPASKSYCPKRIREAVKYEVAILDDINHGPRQAKLNGAYISRDWSGVAAMDWLCGDDATLEIYAFVPDGKGWFTLTRSQFLPMIDVRSLRVLGFGLKPATNYNGAMIRTLITRVCDEHGLPRRGFWFEGATWQSRLLKGDVSADPISWAETELGLRSLGLEFHLSRLPREKPIERVIEALQDLMEGEPGYVGPDEMHEKFERIAKIKLEVEARKTDPSEHFYSIDEWTGRLEEICTKYNATPQDGKMTSGLSPDDAFAKFRRPDDPPIKLPPSCRYLLAHHRRPLKVTSNGITLRFGKQAYNYRNEQTGRLRGQTVLTWWNPDAPEILTVTDMNRENAFCVELSPDVPAVDAPAEMLEQEMKRIAAHQSYARVRYRMLRTKYATPFRRAVVDQATAELGGQMEAQRAAVRTRQDQRAKAQRVYGRLNAVAPAGARTEQIEAMEDLNRLLKQEDKE